MYIFCQIVMMYTKNILEMIQLEQSHIKSVKILCVHIISNNNSFWILYWVSISRVHEVDGWRSFLSTTLGEIMKTYGVDRSFVTLPKDVTKNELGDYLPAHT